MRRQNEYECEHTQHKRCESLCHFTHCTYQQKSILLAQNNSSFDKKRRTSVASHRKGTNISWKINLNTTRMQEIQTFPHNLNMNKATSWKMLAAWLLHPSPASQLSCTCDEWTRLYAPVVYILHFALKHSFRSYELAALSQQTSAFYLALFHFLSCIRPLCSSSKAHRPVSNTGAHTHTHPPHFWKSSSSPLPESMAFSACHCLICALSLCSFFWLAKWIFFFLLFHQQMQQWKSIRWNTFNPVMEKWLQQRDSTEWMKQWKSVATATALAQQFQHFHYTL